MTKSILGDLKPENVFAYFEEISKIPRESGNEKGISDYILGWAATNGFEAVQDENFNLIIKKPASPGNEKAEPLMLQAHMDMVCEKTAESNHDFLQDPILLKAEGDIISSAEGTTLGADDGIGVAFCMAVLADKKLCHPPLEILLTTEEESTFNGVLSVDTTQFSAKQMINLDHAVENQVLAGSCGGQGISLRLPQNRCGNTEVKGECSETYRVKISGLAGGHSGEDIHRGNGNAIELMTRLLFAGKRADALRLMQFSGGSSRLAIPREAEAVVEVEAVKELLFREIIKNTEADFQGEYRSTAPDLRISVEKVERDQTGCLTEDAFERLLQFLLMLPNGIMQMNGDMPSTVESSINLGILKLRENYLEVICEMRNACNSTGKWMENKFECLAKIFGAEYEFFNKYAPWQYKPHSRLRKKAIEVYEAEFSKQLETVVVHAGIECSCLIDRIDGLDAIGIGPNCWSFHSPSERMSISSVQHTWLFLTKLIESLT